MKSKIVWGIKIKSEEQRVESKEQNVLFAWIAKVAATPTEQAAPLEPTRGDFLGTPGLMDRALESARGVTPHTPGFLDRPLESARE